MSSSKGPCNRGGLRCHSVTPIRAEATGNAVKLFRIAWDESVSISRRVRTHGGNRPIAQRPEVGSQSDGRTNPSASEGLVLRRAPPHRPVHLEHGMLVARQ